MYPAHAKRVRKAPERYAVDSAPAAKPSEADPPQTEQRAAAQQIQTHSGQNLILSRVVCGMPLADNIGSFAW